MTPVTTTTTISRRTLSEDNAPAIITQVEHLASYSWIEAPIPTIAVPGIPPRWSPPKISRKLPKDSGLVYIAQNAARHPESPLEPLFRAVYMTNAEFDMSSVDVVTDRNNVRKLLSFIDPSSSRNGLETFTIKGELAGNTVILSRTETKTQEFIHPHEFKGYGHEFEKAYTSCEVTDSTGHHRIVAYRFGGLNLVVRHEVDGYVESTQGLTSSNKGPRTDDLSSLLGSLSLAANRDVPKSITPAGSRMVIRKEGREVPIESTLEIKTRVKHRPLNIDEIAPQLWVSQTLKLVRAYHDRGSFLQPAVEDMSTEIKDWERRNQTNLKKLAALLKQILGVVRGYGGSAVLKYDTVTGKLTITKVDEKPMLPKDLYSKWEGASGLTGGTKAGKA